MTCVAYGLHNVAEELRGSFPGVDHFIANMKSISLKAPSRSALFREEVNLPFPPKPILTRWGTWIVAFEYYAQNFGALKNFECEKFDEANSATIR